MTTTFSLFRGVGPLPIQFHHTAITRDNNILVQKNPAMLLGKTDRLRRLKDRVDDQTKMSYKQSNITNKSMYSSPGVDAYDAMRAHSRIAHHGAAVTGSAARYIR